MNHIICQYDTFVKVEIIPAHTFAGLLQIVSIRSSAKIAAHTDDGGQ